MTEYLDAAERRTEEAEAYRDRMLAVHGDTGHPDVVHADALVAAAEEAEFLVAERQSWERHTA